MDPLRRLSAAERFGRARELRHNPTGHSLPDAGMGVVGGLFIPDRRGEWPRAERGDSLYQVDFRHYMRLSGGHAMEMAGRR